MFKLLLPAAVLSVCNIQALNLIQPSRSRSLTFKGAFPQSILSQTNQIDYVPMNITETQEHLDELKNFLQSKENQQLETDVIQAMRNVQQVLKDRDNNFVNNVGIMVKDKEPTQAKGSQALTTQGSQTQSLIGSSAQAKVLKTEGSDPHLNTLKIRTNALVSQIIPLYEKLEQQYKKEVQILEKMLLAEQFELNDFDPENKEDLAWLETQIGTILMQIPEVSQMMYRISHFNDLVPIFQGIINDLNKLTFIEIDGFGPKNKAIHILNGHHTAFDFIRSKKSNQLVKKHSSTTKTTEKELVIRIEKFSNQLQKALDIKVVNGIKRELTAKEQSVAKTIAHEYAISLLDIMKVKNAAKKAAKQAALEFAVCANMTKAANKTKQGNMTLLANVTNKANITTLVNCSKFTNLTEQAKPSPWSVKISTKSVQGSAKLEVKPVQAQAKPVQAPLKVVSSTKSLKMKRN